MSKQNKRKQNTSKDNRLSFSIEVGSGRVCKIYMKNIDKCLDDRVKLRYEIKKLSDEYRHYQEKQRKRYILTTSFSEDDIDRIEGELAWTMRFPPKKSIRRSRLNALVLREIFRDAVNIHNELAEYYVIDQEEHTSANNVIGCYHSNNSWIVYVNDDFGNQIQTFNFDSQIKAYKKAAELGGFRFKPNMVAVHLADRLGIFSDKYMQLVDKALDSCIFIGENMEGTKTGQQAAKDTNFLNGFLVKRDKAFSALLEKINGTRLLPYKWLRAFELACTALRRKKDNESLETTSYSEE